MLLRRSPRSAVLVILFGALSVMSPATGPGCASRPLQSERFDYFTAPDPYDAWSSKISVWQRRERAESAPVLGSAPPVAERGDGSGDGVAAVAPGEEPLRGKYFDFRASRRREMAREFADWIQSEARRHYVEDGPIDHWATLEETLRSNGDDCDGLELLVYHGLRDLGFSEREVYRAIVYRPSDGQHHMVTLWFEDPDDPWAIDPTGAMVSGMRRMSDVPGWMPLKVFSESAEFTVRPARESAASLASHP